MKDLLPISEIAFMPPFPNPAPPDPVGELAWIDVRDLFIDPKYQRPIGGRGEKNIRQVIENFSWSLFSPLIVARRAKGCYAVIDGQHRAIAALTHGGIEKVPALIINGDASDEAKAFAVINGAVTAILPTQIWHARLVAGDVDALRLQRVFEAEGVTILRSAKAKEHIDKGETTAIDAFEKAYKAHGADVFALALRTVVGTAKGNPGYLRAGVISATCTVLTEHPEWSEDPTGVLKAIRTVGIKYLWDVAARKKIDGKPTTVFAVYCYELTKLLKKVLG